MEFPNHLPIKISNRGFFKTKKYGVWKVEIDLALLKLESARNIVCPGIKENHELIIGEHL